MCYNDGTRSGLGCNNFRVEAKEMVRFNHSVKPIPARCRRCGLRFLDNRSGACSSPNAGLEDACFYSNVPDVTGDVRLRRLDYAPVFDEATMKLC
jgi:hypothetical protein